MYNPPFKLSYPPFYEGLLLMFIVQKIINFFKKKKEILFHETLRLINPRLHVLKSDYFDSSTVSVSNGSSL